MEALCLCNIAANVATVAGSRMPTHETFEIVIKVLKIARGCIAFCDLMEYGFDEAVGMVEAVGVVGIDTANPIVYFER